ncbi:hypothetical protein IHE56_04340 [Streptomyces sp. ID01-12c]|nr:hypothetical protein [Streptomyces caniscabiei]MBD9701332.1 hypothetical protein [Streptomyces caniscabiei]MDX3726488.1 hypothetical protein [Streptomyces caniscabiei]
MASMETGTELLTRHGYAWAAVIGFVCCVAGGVALARFGAAGESGEAEKT